MSRFTSPPPLLDEEVWSVPGRLTDDDLYAETSPGGRRMTRAPDDMEDDR